MHRSRLTAKGQRLIGFAVEGLRQAQSTISYCEIRDELMAQSVRLAIAVMLRLRNSLTFDGRLLQFPPFAKGERGDFESPAT